MAVCGLCARWGFHGVEVGGSEKNDEIEEKNTEERYIDLFVIAKLLIMVKLDRAGKVYI